MKGERRWVEMEIQKKRCGAFWWGVAGQSVSLASTDSPTCGFKGSSDAQAIGDAGGGRCPTATHSAESEQRAGNDSIGLGDARAG